MQIQRIWTYIRDNLNTKLNKNVTRETPINDSQYKLGTIVHLFIKRKWCDVLINNSLNE